MSNPGNFDSTSFAAEGWRKVHDVIETDKGGKLGSAKLVELADIGPGDAVLDVAGGYGEPSLTAARAVGPDGRVVCSDISADMLEFARERAAAAGLSNVEFVESDAAKLDFEPGTFDAIVSRCALMLMPDVTGLVKRLHSFLKPGGRLAAAVWGPPPAVQMMAAMPIIREELALPPPAPGGPGPFALADAERLAEVVEAGGFHDVETGTLTVVIETDTPEQFAEFAFSAAPTTLTNPMKSLPSGDQQRIRNKVIQIYSAFQDASGRVHTENLSIWVVGTR